jgi:hypothetical protein
VTAPVLAAAEEERFTRAKHTKAFPENAIRYCLAHAGLDARDVDTVALFIDPRRQLLLPLANLYHGFPASLGPLASDLGKYRQRTAAPAPCRRSVPPGLPPRRPPRPRPANPTRRSPTGTGTSPTRYNSSPHGSSAATWTSPNAWSRRATCAWPAAWRSTGWPTRPCSTPGGLTGCSSSPPPTTLEPPSARRSHPPGQPSPPSKPSTQPPLSCYPASPRGHPPR